MTRPIRVRDDYKVDPARERLWDAVVTPGNPETFDPAFWLVGAHGGAGVTTLAQLWRPAADAKRLWPVLDKHPRCVIVSRCTRSGIDAAGQTALSVDPRCDLLGVVIVGDAPGKPPKALSFHLDLLRQSAAVPNVWEIPYIQKIRTQFPQDLAQWEPGQNPVYPRKMPPPTEMVPREIAAVGAEIFEAARPHHDSPKE